MSCECLFECFTIMNGCYPEEMDPTWTNEPSQFQKFRTRTIIKFKFCTKSVCCKSTGHVKYGGSGLEKQHAVQSIGRLDLDDQIFLLDKELFILTYSMANGPGKGFMEYMENIWIKNSETS